MASAVENTSSRQYFESLRNYVLSPFPAALKTLEQERGEIEAERRSFECFVQRVEDIECEHLRFGHADGIGRSQRKTLEAVREGYRETVMGVEHYDAVYDNTLCEDVEAEFGSEIAAILCPSTEVPFTDQTRDFLVAAAERSTEQRTAVLERLEKERQSLDSAREQIEDVVKGLDGARIPNWHAETFLENIEDLAATRQATIRRWQTPGFTDGHRLCEYLYEDEPWTYPVLTVLARLRWTTVIPQ